MGTFVLIKIKNTVDTKDVGVAVLSPKNSEDEFRDKRDWSDEIYDSHTFLHSPFSVDDSDISHFPSQTYRTVTNVFDWPSMPFFHKDQHRFLEHKWSSLRPVVPNLFIRKLYLAYVMPLWLSHIGVEGTVRSFGVCSRQALNPPNLPPTS